MMLREAQSVFLADDDQDDCFLFEEALGEIASSARLTMVHDGEQLMQLLAKRKELPRFLFLDLNMPRKNGFECLTEIKQDDRLKELAVIIFSTSFQQDAADWLYKNGAQHYIRKPADFGELKKIIQQVLLSVDKVAGNLGQPTKENFVLT
jgi:CheY-like chemotaxis protein